ncbi:WAT1-related protein At3g28050 [Ziziphus jujuba]|uniref:WAT1-related protein n=2 Tax=Ziziphus jujuba TaxID=326968 RepID=A0A6P4AAC1_ZIZJJ|nr:WAT1-related protein At3g28050 [Ziziphus jujuba]KAH7528501.1 hypothetical protein FEM48_Zijuj05G0078800 [Ziziphus jujuba var. spinosa]
MGIKSCLVKFLPFAVMVVVQCLDVGLTTLSKAAMSRGMSHYVFVVYANALASLILFPSSFIIERKRRPPLTFSILCKFFLLSLVGITMMQNCAFTGVNYSSPTLASAMTNLVPAFTFSLAVIFRMEKLDLKSSRSQMKLMGTLLSISGAMVVTLYKGPPILKTLQVPSTEKFSASKPFFFSTMLKTTPSNWVIGSLFLAISSLSYAISNTAQAAILKEYPSQITMVSFFCFFGAIQCATLSLFAERDPNAWILKPDIELICILYSAICGCVGMFTAISWCIKMKGPVFVSMFTPLEIAIASILATIFLGETLYVGSVIGAVVIVIGFYGVIWTQFKEEKDENHEVNGPQSSSVKTPLLETHRTDV